MFYIIAINPFCSDHQDGTFSNQGRGGVVDCGLIANKLNSRQKLSLSHL